MEKLTGVFGLSILAVVFLVYGLPAHAIPCEPRLLGQGLEGSVGCLNGAPGDNVLGQGDDKAYDLNAGNYFGFNDWSFLQLQGAPSNETVVDVGLSVGFTNPINPVMGSWSIFESTWDNFDDLVVILKSDTTGEDMIYWSSYLLGVDLIEVGSWFSRRPLSSFSVFGRVALSIPEPRTWSMVAAGLVVLTWAGKIRRKRIFPA
jgi:hypothetical protein